MRNKVLLILAVLVLMASAAAAPALAEPVDKAVPAEEAMPAEEVAPVSEEAVPAEKTIPDEEAVPAEKAATVYEVVSAEQKVAAEQPQALLPEGFECEPSYTSPDGSTSTNDCVLRPAHDDKDEQGDNGVVRGCPEDYYYYYDEDVGRCSPDHLLFSELLEMPDSLGEAVGWLGVIPADSLKSLGLGTWSLLDYAVGDTLSGWGEEIGGPLGYGLKGLGGIFSFTGTVAGGLLESAGHFVDDLSDGVGGVIDDVGDAAEDVWDGITGGWW